MMPTQITILPAIFAVCALAVSPVRAQTDVTPDVTVRVHDSSQVTGERFTLHEIADVTGTDKAYVAQVAAIEVGTSPLPGQSRLVLVGDIQVRIRFNHLDPKRIRVVAAPSMRVERVGVVIPVADMVQAAADKLTDERKKLNDGATVEPAQLPSAGFSASGKRQYQAAVVHGNL